MSTVASGKYKSAPEITHSRRFQTTHWSLVAAAGAPTSAESRAALAALCEAYWYPLYAYLRRRGHGVDSAEELAQAFFAMLIESNTLKNADRSLGRFRSYLLGALKHFLGTQSQQAKAAKRGGGRRIVSLDTADAENRLHKELIDNRSPERIFDRQWALNVLNLALARLQEQFQHEGKTQLFANLHRYLTADDSELKYRQLCEEMEMSEGAIKVAVHRMRARYRQMVRQQVARTVASPSDVDDEIRRLFIALRA
jgi:RNA polymerase sigma-70 factor (ECF subfamily)